MIMINFLFCYPFIDVPESIDCIKVVDLLSLFVFVSRALHEQFLRKCTFIPSLVQVMYIDRATIVTKKQQISQVDNHV